MTALGQGWIAMPKLPWICSAPTPTEETTTPTQRKIRPCEIPLQNGFGPAGRNPCAWSVSRRNRQQGTRQFTRVHFHDVQILTRYPNIETPETPRIFHTFSCFLFISVARPKHFPHETQSRQPAVDAPLRHSQGSPRSMRPPLL